MNKDHSACMRVVSERSNRTALCISKVILDLLNTQFEVGDTPLSLATLSVNVPGANGKSTTLREIQVKHKQTIICKTNNLQELFEHILQTLNKKHKKLSVDTLNK